MLQWVYERARESTLLDRLLVATDSDAVHRFCVTTDIPVMMTGPHPSGSDRLHEVMDRIEADIYVNIQGDEPTVRADHIKQLIDPLIEGRAEVSTLKIALDAASAHDSNIVKVVTDNSGRALYFSRFPIPFERDAGGMARFYKHIGLYGYTRAALELFHSLPQSSLELAEKLEQLRYLENSIDIYVAETTHDTIGVDTAADLDKAAAILAPRQRRRSARVGT